MLATRELTELQWESVHALSQTLAEENADVNELGKAIAYLRTIRQQKDAGTRFFTYLNVLVKKGNIIKRSGQTPNYYKIIEKACSKYLKPYEGDAETMLQILGWAARLTRYYKNAGPIGERESQTSASQSVQKIKRAEINKSHKFYIGQHLPATVTNIKGNKLSYEIFGILTPRIKEPKKAKDLTEGQHVQVEVTDLYEDGSLKKVKYVGPLEKDAN